MLVLAPVLLWVSRSTLVAAESIVVGLTLMVVFRARGSFRANDSFEKKTITGVLFANGGFLMMIAVPQVY